jgi:hypothetical protein
LYFSLLDIKRLIRVGYASHAAHNTNNVVVNSVDTYLGSGSSGDGGARKNKLKNSVVNTREVARSRWLVLFGSQGEGVDVDTSIRVASVVLERLDNIKVRSFTFRETILSVELQLGSNNRVLSPTVHVKSSLGKNKGTSIRDRRSRHSGGCERSHVVTRSTSGRGPVHTSTQGAGVNSTSHLEKSRSVDEGTRSSSLGLSPEDMDSRRKSINGISVVEGLGTKGLEKNRGSIKRRAVVDVSIRLNNPDKFLARVVEVELNLIGGRSNRLVSGELELLNEVLMRVLGHLAALICIKEDIVDVQRGSNKRLLVGSRNRLGSGRSSQRLDSPQALTNRTEVNVDLDLVVLESNERKSESRVAAEPEEKRNVKCGFRESLARSANLGRSARRSARSRHLLKGRISDVSELGGVANHLVVTLLLFRRESELIPDVHPVAVVTIDALSSNLNLNLGNELLTNEIQPTSIDTVSARSHVLVNFRESNLKVGAVGKITVSANCACHAASKVSLSGEGLLNRLHSEVGVSAVRHLPVGDLGCTSKENVLCAIGDELHKCSSHFFVFI